MSILVIDVGTSGVRAAIVTPDARMTATEYREVLPCSPAAGLVEFDAAHMAAETLSAARRIIAEHGPVDAVGIANQRASTVVWDRASGVPVGPGLGWQDLRTIGECLTLQAEGLRLAPSVSATKLAHLLDTHDPDRERDLCFGTIDTWLVWNLSAGSAHVTDATNVALTGLIHHDRPAWDQRVLDLLRIPERVLPAIVDSSGEIAEAAVLDGSPPILGMAGDQQASLIGQGCVRPGLTKITFGTGGMLDTALGAIRPGFDTRGAGGTFPIITWGHRGTPGWGIEAIMLSAGTNVEWLRDDLGLIATAAESHELAASCADSGGVVFVPALLGLGTPEWDYGARGTLLGVTRGVGRAQIVRAVLEGIAHRGTDLVESAETDSGSGIPSLRIDGGMSRNPTFVQALADASQRTVEVSPVVEATTLGAAFLAGLEAGTWSGWDDIAATWNPSQVVEPVGVLDRDRWRQAVARAREWYPELSSLDF